MPGPSVSVWCPFTSRASQGKDWCTGHTFGWLIVYYIDSCFSTPRWTTRAVLNSDAQATPHTTLLGGWGIALVFMKLPQWSQCVAKLENHVLWSLSCIWSALFTFAECFQTSCGFIFNWCAGYFLSYIGISSLVANKWKQNKTQS